MAPSPRYGIWLKRTPSDFSIAPTPSCGTEPSPACPYDSLPGAALARATRSCMDWIGESGLTAMAKTFSNTWQIGSTRSGLKGIVLLT